MELVLSGKVSIPMSIRMEAIRYGGRFMLEPDVWRMIKEKGYGKRAPLSSALFRRVLEKGLDSIYLTAVEKALIKRQIGTLPS